jgi:hypothetical protein
MAILTYDEGRVLRLHGMTTVTEDTTTCMAYKLSTSWSECEHVWWCHGNGAIELSDSIPVQQFNLPVVNCDNAGSLAHTRPRGIPSICDAGHKKGITNAFECHISENAGCSVVLDFIERYSEFYRYHALGTAENGLRCALRR